MRGCPTKKEGVREASGGLRVVKLQEVQVVKQLGVEEGVMAQNQVHLLMV